MKTIGQPKRRRGGQPKPSRETIRKRIATRRRNAAFRAARRRNSEEAKKSPADAARQAAFHRLERDGAHSTAAIQRRVRVLAQERNIPPADIHKLMYKRPSTHSVMIFCQKYKVSYDWLLCGDLWGLARMERERKQTVA
jgi:hypothetical protein